MKVLEEGKDIGWTINIICDSCKSKLNIEPKDIIRHKYEAYVHRNGGIYLDKKHLHYIICPKCDQLVCLEEQKIEIPPHVQAYAVKNNLKTTIK